jgi:hypothetical protein
MLTEASGTDGAIEVASIGLTLHLAEVYAQIRSHIVQPEAP